MNLLNQINDPEKKEIVAEARKELKFKGSIPNPNRLPLWRLDKNLELTRVIYKNASVQRGERKGEPETVRLRVDFDPESLYVLAINEKNAARKFFNILKKYQNSKK